MKSVILTPGKQKKRLRWVLLLFFISLSLPVYYLLQTVYSQLENEAYFTARQQAETLVDQIELKLKHVLEKEQNRPIAEYQFFNVMANPLLSESAGVKFSPLSEIPPKTGIKGLVGYFQINTDGSFHLPALPELGQDNLSGLSLAELESRLLLKQEMRTLLSIQTTDNVQITKKDKSRQREKENNIKAELVVKNQPYIKEFKQKTFSMTGEVMSSTQVNRPKQQKIIALDESAKRLKKASRQIPPKSAQKKYNTRKETVQLPDQIMASSYFNRSQQKASSTATLEQEDKGLPLTGQLPLSNKTVPSIINILSFESEVTPLQLLPIGQDYFCFYRYIWHDNNRYTQGFIVNSRRFLKAVVQPLVNSGSFSSLIFSDSFNVSIPLPLRQREIEDYLSNKPTSDTGNQEFELYKRPLAMPFQKIELFVNTAKLANVPGSLLIDLLAFSLFFLFFVGFIVFYRLGSKQIDLARQQQNFISAVSHELKTPLTSIRMYSEMLRSGWAANEAKKQDYFNFIFFESERLSRLISNVLQLARLGQQHKTDINRVSAKTLLDRTPSKIEAQIESSSFELNIIQAADITLSTDINIDEDAFFQIVINLVDNAIKFANKAEIQQIDIGFRMEKSHKHIVFFVRDYGPGIKKNQLKNIFTLFYRSEDELTRTTPGTGIGLALVAELVSSMQATCTVVNKHPGAEFQIKFSP